MGFIVAPEITNKSKCMHGSSFFASLLLNFRLSNIRFGIRVSNKADWHTGRNVLPDLPLSIKLIEIHKHENVLKGIAY